LCALGLSAALPALVTADDTPATTDAPTSDVSAAAGDAVETDQDAGATHSGAGGDAAPAPVSQADVDAAALAGHNAWMLTSTALVLFMTAPGLAMFYGGLVRKKNVLSVLMQCLFLMGLMTVVWALWGYSFSFGGSNPFFGSGEFVFMTDVSRSWSEEGAESYTDENGNGQHDEGEPYTDVNENEKYDTMGPYTPMEGGIPRLTHMLFQGMFFIITPALICGAFAERMKFSAMVVFLVLWGTFVYCPLCHWVWDGGILAFGNETFPVGGALDFAGGTVVHISSGVSALICALLIGPRLGFGTEDMRPHNLTYTALGAGMLWVGWFGFNAGSELLSDDLTSSAFAVTHFSAAAGAVGWAAIEWITRGKPSVLGAASGAVAGLVCITPAAGFVNPMPALAMGLAAGIVCYYACSALKSKLGYDDSLDAFGVHGIGGTLGAVLTGVFATRACWDIDGGNCLGLLEGGTKVIVGQIVAVMVTWVFAVVGTLVILKVVDLVLGLRVSQDGEVEGLDLSEHGEEGYIFN
jgi:Amt family ammonium transporter